ncbi:RNA-directed DNA polymerase [Aquitalea magnusonii]|uniref:Retron-type reverse transcriptase n=1 Tax=Aquitalea magnusonii TaxID=332411 RepID=A0A318JGA7_9NEIS|nr:RNA-directed DNA polymerase [Aquitalea magnusonii]PXX49410.1 retron-type reverse transcriptase [Aquitalea magnusonii]
MSSVRGPSADSSAGHADFSFRDLVEAYFDCRRTKRNSRSQLAFEANLERNLIGLFDELQAGIYRPGQSICFVVTQPKPREVWAAAFRDRVVHHLLYNHIAPRFHASFITNSCACIPGRGTLYAAQQLDGMIRSASQNWSRPVHYLKLDLANFFVSIDKDVLRHQLAAKIPEPWWMRLAEIVLFHDPRTDFEFRGRTQLMQRVPAHKQLLNQPTNRGLPIGNLSSQFFANVYLNALDQFAKHQIKARYYVRYVDDFILLHESPQWLNGAKGRIEEFLQQRLHVQINPKKTILQPVDRGVDFVGQVIKPWSRTTRRRSQRQAIERCAHMDRSSLFEAANSYFGLLGQAQHSHGDRAKLANTLLRRGYSVKSDMTKIYRRKFA